MKAATRFLAVTVLCVFAAACGGGSSADGLKTGAFTARVNGAAFDGHFAWYNAKGGQILIWGVTADEKRYIEITTDRPAAVPATRPLSSSLSHWGMYDTDSNSTGNEFYTFDPPSGTLTITALTASRCTGTFSFTARNRNTGEVVTVAGGTFDVPFSESGW